MKNFRCIVNGEVSQHKVTSNKRKVYNEVTEIKKKKNKNVVSLYNLFITHD
jgi:hypothetical protein